MDDERPDRHTGKRTTVRLPDEVKAPAQQVLAKHGWTINDFIVASLTLVAANPDAMLKRLNQFRPTPKRGRPKKT